MSGASREARASTGIKIGASLVYVGRAGTRAVLKERVTRTRSSY